MATAVVIDAEAGGDVPPPCKEVHLLGGPSSFSERIAALFRTVLFDAFLEFFVGNLVPVLEEVLNRVGHLRPGTFLDQTLEFFDVVHGSRTARRDLKLTDTFDEV